MRRTENPPYYIGAYEIAVRNGFRGTREEFGLLLGRGAAAAEGAEAAAAYADRAAQEAQASAETAEAARSAAEAAEENAGEAAAAADLEAQAAQASAETAEAAARMAEGWATGESSGTPSETNNAKYYAETAGGFVARPFSAETVYHETDLAIYGGKLYVFTRDHSGAWSESDAAELVLGDYVQDLDGEIEEWGRQLAEEFDEQESYGAGELVLREGLLYVFTQDHSGEWTGLDVQRTTTAAAIAGHYVTAGQKSGTTLGEKATAEGTSTTASGDYSHAEGSHTTASGDYSHAEGRGSTASGERSHAEGGSTASGNYAHAEGFDNTASGQGTHAEGMRTVASGNYAHAEGIKTIANHKAQHVFGEYNLEDDSTHSALLHGNYVEIVGNGTGDDDRSNARTLDWDGNEVLAGKLTLGAGPTNAMDAATKQYVDDHSYTAGDGIEISNGVISMPDVFYDYLEEQTYEAPAIAAFSVSGLGGAAEIGSSVAVTAMKHRETNPGNVTAAGLTLKLGDTVLLSGVTPAGTEATVSFAEQTVTRSSAGSVSFTLSGTNTRGGTVTATVSKSFYVPKFLGSSAGSSITAADILQFSKGQSIPTSITTAETSYIWFVTNGTISSVKDANTGFGVPIEAAVNITVGINGVDVSYRAYRTSNRIAAGTYSFTIS